MKGLFKKCWYHFSVPTAPALVTLIAFLATAVSVARAATCDSLANLKLPDTTITFAQAAPGGTLTPPYGPAVENLPAFCRMTGRITPTSDSDIYFEVWLPTCGWNGKFLG